MRARQEDPALTENRRNGLRGSQTAPWQRPEVDQDAWLLSCDRFKADRPNRSALRGRPVAAQG
jgi:hypothetical protein